jgi:hypothetical protein
MLLNNCDSRSMSLRVRLLSGCLLAGLALAAPGAQAAEPTTAQCLAASESSIALRNHHKLHDALKQLLVCSVASCPGDVRNECTRLIAAVNAAMPSIVFEAQDAAGNDLAAVTVTMDGQPLTERLDGSALSIDPGEHAFSFSAAGRPKVEKRFVLREGEKARRERIVLASLPAPAAPAPVAAAPPMVTSPAEQPAAAEPSGGLGTQRIMAIVAAGVGVAGVGVGIGFGVHSMSKHDQAKTACPDASTCPDSNGVTLWHQAVIAGDVATLAFVVGAIGLGSAATLWFTATPHSGPADSKPTTQVGLGLGTLQLRGTW